VAAAGVALGAAALALVYSMAFFDITADGPSYHEPAVLHLRAGWNPVWDGPLPTGPYENLWTNHYPKASWTFAAAVLALAGRIEAGKWLGPLLLVATLLLCIVAAQAILKRRSLGLAVGVLCAVNPVAVYQSASFYVDGLLASSLTSFAALLALQWLAPDWLLLGTTLLCIAFVVNLKFTATVYVAVLGGLAIGFFLAARRPGARRLAVGSVAAMAGGVLLIGCNPYVTNTLRYGHPFYPLMGPGHVDVMAGQMPASFLSENRVRKLAESVFGRSSNDAARVPEWKLPLAVSSAELRAFGYADVRVGGFGPFFAAALLLSIGGMLGGGKLKPSYAGLLPIAAIAVSVLVNPEGWWARYAPQLWLVPLLAAAAASTSRGAWPRRAAAGALLLLAIDVLVVAGAYGVRQFQHSAAVRAQLRSLAACEISSRGLPNVARRRLEEAGVSLADSSACAESFPLQDLPVDACAVRCPGGGAQPRGR